MGAKAEVLDTSNEEYQIVLKVAKKQYDFSTYSAV